MDTNISTNTSNISDNTGLIETNISAIELNTAKVGITETQANNITTNNAKVGITETQANNITTNNAKIGITETQTANILANNLKVGITTTQAENITTNNAKIGITETQSSNIAANTLKVGITSTQADAITANTEKTGITEEQATAITSNTASLTDKLSKTGGTMTGNLIIDDGAGATPVLRFTNGEDSNGSINVDSNGKIIIKTGGATRMKISSSDCDITGNIVVSGTVDGVDIATRDAVITSNTNSISSNTTSIESNTSSIETNTGNISTNATAISGKQATITLTTEGTSGAATLGDGTLNIPQYSGGGSTSIKCISVGTTTNTVISSGGNVGSKEAYTTVALNTVIGGLTAATPFTVSSSKVRISENGTYKIDYSLATTVSGSANRTLAGGMLFKTIGEEEYSLVGTQVYNYDRGTATSSGASSWGTVYQGSGSSSCIIKITEIDGEEISYITIHMGFWIVGRASSSSGITLQKDGTILNIMKIA